jgi:hypothetical protein
MDYAAQIALLQQRIKATQAFTPMAGPVQQMAIGATDALYQIALALTVLAQLADPANKPAAPAPAPKLAAPKS